MSTGQLWPSWLKRCDIDFDINAVWIPGVSQQLFGAFNILRALNGRPVLIIGFDWRVAGHDTAAAHDKLQMKM